MNKVIFELPIYSCSQKDFDKYWEQKEDATIKDAKLSGSSDDIIQCIILQFSPKNIWKYNQIIGYITVSINSHDVLFDLYLALDKKTYKNSTTKHFIQNVAPNATHFYIENKTDAEIKNEIESQIDFIRANHLKSNYYIDDTIIKNLLPYIDIRKIIDDLKKDDHGQECN